MTTRATPVVALALASLALASPLYAPLVYAQPRATPARVEGIAALVGANTAGPGTIAVLRSDVILRAHLALAGHTEVAPTGSLPDDLLAATLEELIGEALIAREADRLRAASPEDDVVAAQLAQLERSAGGAARVEAVLRRLGSDREELTEVARRRAYVDAFLRANLSGGTLVSDAEVERVQTSGEHPFTARPAEETRELIRAWISQANLRRDVARWIEVLRARTVVRVLAEWRTAEAEGPRPVTQKPR